MSNFKRTYLSSYWGSSLFADMTLAEKVFYLYLHTSDETSDTGAFSLRINIAAARCGVGIPQMKKLIARFEELGILYFDAKTQETVVLDYFDHHPPASSLSYEMYESDLSKIRSDAVIDRLAEMAKDYPICRTFFLALRTRKPDINEKDYRISATKSTDEELMTAAKRGRDGSKKAKEEKRVLSSQEVDEEELPY